MSKTRTRRSNSDDLIEARAEITRLRAENEQLRAIIVSAKASNDLVHSLVRDLVDKLKLQLTQPAAERSPDQPHS